jgi:hypothetical protein
MPKNVSGRKTLTNSGQTLPFFVSGVANRGGRRFEKDRPGTRTISLRTLSPDELAQHVEEFLCWSAMLSNDLLLCLVAECPSVATEDNVRGCVSHATRIGPARSSGTVPSRVSENTEQRVEFSDAERR